MAKKKLVSSTKRFGPRYGKLLKDKFAKIERDQRAKHTCPYCHYKKVRRLALGIWQCNKCNVKFAGSAYNPSSSKMAALE